MYRYLANSTNLTAPFCSTNQTIPFFSSFLIPALFLVILLACLPCLTNRKSRLQILRSLLGNDSAEKAFLEKLDHFKQNPELLEKYLIGGEVNLEVLDLFLTRLFGSEGLWDVADAKESVKSVLDSLRVKEKSDSVCEKSTERPDDHWAVVKELQNQVLNLTRQVCAIQRQLQMQGEVLKLAASIEGRLDEVASACERRVAETDETLRAEIRKVDVTSQVSDVASRLEELQGELGLTARAEDLQKLEEKVSRLDELASACERRALETDEIVKVDVSSQVSDVATGLGELVKEGARLQEAEQGLSVVETRATETELVLQEEIRGKIERIEMVMAPLTDPLDGIIAWLTRECGGNVHREGVVKVTASRRGGGQPENVVDFGSNSHICTTNSPNSWIRYDFVGWRVTPTSYSITSYGDGPGYDHPRSWVFEVSNDGSEGSWDVVDSRENNKELNAKLVTRTFAISAPPSGSFRFVRLRQTGKNHAGNDFLEISALELFGTLSSE